MACGWVGVTSRAAARCTQWQSRPCRFRWLCNVSAASFAWRLLHSGRGWHAQRRATRRLRHRPGIAAQRWARATGARLPSHGSHARRNARFAPETRFRGSVPISSASSAAPAPPRASTSRSACACTTSTGATPTRRRCCWCTAGATIAATGTGWRRSCAATGTSSRPTCAATATANGRGRQLHDGGLHLRSGPAHPSARSWRPVTIIAHSLGGNIALRYAGLYPENVARLVAIEGLGPSPEDAGRALRQAASPERMRDWIDEQRGLSGRLPRRYATIEDAFKRMQEENKHLSPEQARHLTAPRRQPERGRHLQLEVRQLRALLAALRHDRRPRSRRCGRASPARRCWSTARRAGPPTRRGRPRAALQERRGRHRRAAPATGCTTTSSTSSWP